MNFRFNKKAKKGIQYLQDQNLLGNTPDDIAEWFHTDERVSKTVIGDFLGENEKYALIFNFSLLYFCILYFSYS